MSLSLIILALLVVGTILCAIKAFQTHGQDPGWWGATIIGVALTLWRVG